MSIIDQLKALLSGASGNILGEIPEKAGALIGGAIDPRFTYEDYLRSNRAENERLQREAPVANALGGALGTGASVLSGGSTALASKAPLVAQALSRTGGLIPQALMTAGQVGSTTDSPALGAGAALAGPVAGKAIGAGLGAIKPAVKGAARFMSKGRLTPEIEDAYLANPDAIKNAVSRDEIASGAEDLAVRAKRYGGERSAAAVDAARGELGNIYPKDVVEAFDAKMQNMPKTVASPTGLESKQNLMNARKAYLGEIGRDVQDVGSTMPYSGAQLKLDPDVLKRDLQGFGEVGDFESYGVLDDLLKRSPTYKSEMASMAPSVGASVRLSKRLGDKPSGNTVANQLIDSEVSRLRGGLPSSQADNLIKDINLLESNPAFGSKIGQQAKERAMHERLMGDRTQGSSGVNLWSILGGGLGGAAVAGAGNAMVGDDKAGKMSLGAGAALGAAMGGIRDKQGGRVAMSLLDAYKKAPTDAKRKVLEEMAKRSGVAIGSMVGGSGGGEKTEPSSAPYNTKAGGSGFTLQRGQEGESSGFTLSR